MVRKRAAMAAAGAVLTLTLVPTGAAAAAPARAEAPVTAVAADEPDPLPNFFGRNLFHVYSTVSAETALQRHDLSGENRKVLWPPNWKVCTQSPKAGTKLHGGTLKLGVVKTDEKCPQR